MADLLYRLSLTVLPPLFVGLTRVWFSTCRIEVRNHKYVQEAIADGPAIATFWHYSFAYNFYHLRKFPAAIMVSASRDGEYIAKVAGLMGHIPLRGSSNRQGVQALRAMVKEVGRGTNGGIVADGSKGPRRKLQPGCILVASRTGRPILPIAWAADRYIAFNSWDKTVLPLPFSKIVLSYGAPFHVPDRISGEDVERLRNDLDRQLNALYQEVWQAVGRPPHDGGLPTE